MCQTSYFPDMIMAPGPSDALHINDSRYRKRWISHVFWALINPEQRSPQSRLKALTELENVDSTNEIVIFNPSSPFTAQRDAFNPENLRSRYSRGLGGAQNTKMTNSQLLFTECAITVCTFSAQNIMHYLSEYFYGLIMPACDFLISIYRFSH